MSIKQNKLLFHIDIDECISGDHDCNSNNYCVNKVGGYKCVCDNGYVLNGTNCSMLSRNYLTMSV